LPAHIIDQNLGLLKKQMNFTGGGSEVRRPFIWGMGILLGGLGVLFDKYTALKKTAKAYDFNDLLNCTLHHLVSGNTPDSLPNLKWVQVDEAQDLNETQWEIMRRILHPDAHLVIFADPDQAIFSFLGGSVERLAHMMARLQVQPLQINFRSPDYLLQFYKDYARRNLNVTLKVHARNQSAKSLENMVFLICDDDHQEIDQVSGHIIPSLLENAPDTVAVLSRTNRNVEALSSGLSSAGLSHFVVSEFDLFRLKIAKDYFACLQVLRQPVSRLQWTRILFSFGRCRTLRIAFDTVNRCFDAGILPHWLLDDSDHPPRYPPQTLMQRLNQGRVVVFDTETTGLDLSIDDIIQFAAVEIVHGRIGRSLNLYLHTDRPLGESSRIHGITRETLQKRGVDRSRGFQQILDFIGNDPVVAHNLRFDTWMMDSNIRRVLGRPFIGTRPAFCTLEMARALHPDLPRHSLAYLITRYKIDGANTHDALDDVKATARLLLAMRGPVDAQTPQAVSFYQNHETLIRNLRTRFGPFWNQSMSDWIQPYTFHRLFDAFNPGDKTPPYDEKHIREIENKLLRHMRKTVVPKPLFQLLDRDLPQYLLYKEPDLILDEDRLIVSTIHRAKGLEFDAVIIPGCHSNAYPGFFARNNPDLRSEDARVLYVGITRARTKLVICCPEYYTTTNGNRMRVNPSPFIGDLLHHFTVQDIRRVQQYEPSRGYQCPKCGRRYSYDGSVQQDGRCFGCGYIP
nr:3'-5' exonuclease [bacterium]